MKRIFLIIALFCSMGIHEAMAQDVFNQVVSHAKLTLEDPEANKFQLSIAQFKFTAMQYLCTTAIKENGGEVAADFLDQQAYSMNHFITSYFSELAKAQHASNSTQKDVMLKFWRASNSNPMFENQDKETTEAFINDPECITPFSINTNWEKADAAISEK